MKVPTSYTPRTEESARGLAYLDTSASPEAFGSAIGKGLANAGEGAQTLGNSVMVQEKQKNEKIEDFDLARRLTLHNTEFNDEVDGIKKGAPVSGIGVKKSVEEAFDKRFGGFMSTVPERAQSEYAYKIQQLRSQRDLDAQNFENTASRTYFKTGVSDETSKSKVAVNQAPELFEAERARLFETIDKTGLSEIEKNDLKREADRGLASVLYKRQAADGTFTAMNTPVQGAVGVFLRNVFSAESGNNPNAKNSASTASGLGQFLDKTWVEQLRATRPDLTQGQPDEALYALKLDPQISKEVTARYATENALKLRSAGITPTPANIYLAHFLGPSGAQRVLTAKDEAPIETVVSSDAYDSNRAVFNKTPTVRDLKAWARGKMGDQGFTAISATQDSNGFWTAPGVEYDLAGKQRPLPPSKEYIEKVIPAVQAADPGVSIRITSGGQEPGKGTGSHRHDIDSKGESGTTDFVLLKNGKPIRPDEDKALYTKVIENLAAQGFTGIGHYSWGLHVGGGTRAKWGPDKSGATLDPQFSAAIDRGWARAADGGRDALDTDSRFSSLTYEDRVALRQDGAREAQAQSNAMIQQQEATRKQGINQLYTDIFDGKAGQADIDRARAAGQLVSFEEISRAAEILRKKTADGADLQAALAKLQTPGAVWSPSDSDDKKMLNAVIGDKGKEAIANMDRDYFSHSVIPVVERSRDIPTDVVGTLTGMTRSRDQKQVLFALDALSQLQRTSQRAYDDRVSSDTQNDVTRYATLRNTMPADELVRTINGGNTQEERQANEMRRKDGERLLATKDGKVPKLDTLVKDVVGQYGGWFTSTPAVGQSAAAAKGLQRFAEELWLTEYIKSGSEDASTAVVKEAVKARYGVTELGGKGKVLMELPPDRAGYRPIGGSYNWIDREVRELLKLKPDEKYELMTDEQTRQEFAAMKTGSRPPSYGIIKLDSNGVPRAGVFNENGTPKRVWFQPKAAELQKEIDDFQMRNDEVTNREFFNTFDKLREQHSWGGKEGAPDQATVDARIPQEFRDEYAARKRRQDEIRAARDKAAIDTFAARSPRNSILDPELRLVEPQMGGIDALR